MLALAEQSSAADNKSQSTLSTPASQKEPVLGSVRPEDLPSLIPENEFTDWMKQERIRVFGWVDGGYTYSSAGDGLLANAPTSNRFGNEVLLNGAWLIIERQLAFSCEHENRHSGELFGNRAGLENCVERIGYAVL